MLSYFFYFILQSVLISYEQFQAIHIQQVTYFPLSFMHLISTISSVQLVC